MINKTTQYNRYCGNKKKNRKLKKKYIYTKTKELIQPLLHILITFFLHLFSNI